MDTWLVILIVVIIIVAAGFLVCNVCMKPSKILGFTSLEKNQLKPQGYARKNDPYDKPFILPHLLTPNQCKQIISHASPRLVDSEVVGGKFKNIRNSKQYWIPISHPLVRPLFKKVSAMFHIPIENAEDLQVVRYLPNQYYREHHDACCDNDEKCRDFVGRGGQRILTVLIYLNNEFGEGNTYFKNLDLKLKPPTGSAIAFYPLARDSNKCHPYALHAGMPVTSGEKWIANLWFRERAFR